MRTLGQVVCCWLAFGGLAAQAADVESFDAVVYGGTSGGVAAAVKLARLGKSVALVEPSRHLGGLSSGGLGATDIGNKRAIGGLSREFYRRVAQHYARPEAWTHQRREDYKSYQTRADEATMWTFEPHVAEQIFNDLVREAKVNVLVGERFERPAGAVKQGRRLVAIRLESGRTLRGRMFFDATYEGDLLAAAGVSYTIGREGNDKYDETLNGVQTKQAIHHQFVKAVDPYVVPGDAASGLLPGIEAAAPEPDGTGDRRVQAYNFRMCMSSAAGNRTPWPKPDDYDERQYELLLRNFEAGDERLPYTEHAMPNHKTDSNNNFAVSTDFIGQNYAWAEADYATREQIFAAHRNYQMGLMWTLANSPRVPEAVRKKTSGWGLPTDEFQSSGGWPHQLYVREARRMVSGYVMNQHNCQGRRVAEDAIGLAAYTMDSHHVRRHVRDGAVRNEGDVQVGGFPPYKIAYRSIVPKAEECENLLVPVCLSASHIAYGSIRMEPVFMVLGESAAVAAALALESDCAVQAIDYAKLRQRLLDDGQVLEWTVDRPNPKR